MGSGEGMLAVSSAAPFASPSEGQLRVGQLRLTAPASAYMQNAQLVVTSETCPHSCLGTDLEK